MSAAESAACRMRRLAPKPPVLLHRSRHDDVMRRVHWRRRTIAIRSVSASRGELPTRAMNATCSGRTARCYSGARRAADFGATSCHGSTSNACATFASQSIVGLVSQASTANRLDRATPAKSARAVSATRRVLANARMFRATSARRSLGSTLATVRALQHSGVRYTGLLNAGGADADSSKGRNFRCVFCARRVR